MPSSSVSQYKLMMFAAMNADFAKKKGISQEVAKEWHESDEKKKKEDPEWFYNLPEKAEKKSKAHEASMESISSFFSKLLGVSLPRSDSNKGTPQQVELNYVKKLFKDAHLLDEIKLKEGKIDTKTINQDLLLRHFNDRTWLSDLENGVAQITNYAKQFFSARLQYADEMHKIYKKCETLEPSAALEYASGATNAAKRKLDAVAPPKFILAIDASKLEHGYKFSAGTPGQSPYYMNALTKGQVKKVLSLLPHLFSVDAQLFTADEQEDMWWTLDDTDETKWWMHKYPDDDHIWGKMLDLFPCAGDFYEYEYEDQLNVIVAKIRRGCEDLINLSVDGRQNGYSKESSEEYKEGPTSTVTHQGSVYLVDDLIAAAKHLPVGKIELSKLAWMMKGESSSSNSTRTRIGKADVNEPILVNEYEPGKFVTMDGFHRVQKALKEGIKTLPVKMIPQSLIDNLPKVK